MPLALTLHMPFVRERMSGTFQKRGSNALVTPNALATGPENDKSPRRGFPDLCPVANGGEDATDALVPGNIFPGDEM